MSDVGMDDPWAAEAVAPASVSSQSSHSFHSSPANKEHCLGSLSVARSLGPPSFNNFRLAGESPPTNGDFAREIVKMDYVQGTYHAVTSKTAQRTLLNTVLLVTTSAILYGFAVVGYLLFYHNYLPDQVTTVPVHLQYGYGLNPYGVASLHDKNLKDLQAYDVTVSLTLPRSPTNLNRGNFMVALHLLTTDTSRTPLGSKSKPKPLTGPTPSILPPYPEYPAHPAANAGPAQPNPHEAQFSNAAVLFTSTRPALIPYADPLVSLASRVFFLAYYVLFPHAERAQLSVPMAEKVSFARGGPLPSQLFVELQAGQDLQVYDAAVTLTAQLSGLRYFMHHYWLASFVVFSAAFWMFEVCFMAVAWVGLSVVLGSGESAAEKGAVVKAEQAKLDGEDMSDTERTFPSTSRQMPLKYEGRVKREEDEGFGLRDVALQAGQGGEADDEDDETEFRDSGIGSTSFSEGNRDGVRKRSSGSRGRR